MLSNDVERDQYVILERAQSAVVPRVGWRNASLEREISKYKRAKYVGIISRKWKTDS